jgi:hypothetical protein
MILCLMLCQFDACLTQWRYVNYSSRTPCIRSAVKVLTEPDCGFPWISLPRNLCHSVSNLFDSLMLPTRFF